ncbi:MAG: tetratricopeptide repeat protein [Silicimonas sp.]|jgi:tetratricopeptide (TPR) repeat protein|nr:tetratricopeptide repeat protein [Silicimonas sp.]
MLRFLALLKHVVAAVYVTFATLGPVSADEAELEALFEGLRGEDPAAAAQIEGRIYDLWSKSGSPSMDLLLNRGRDAMEAGDFKRAVEHFTALIDHAPEFAEGYNARATAFFQSRQLGLSLADIQRTLALNPRHFGAMSGLALILEEIGRPEDALAAWREVEALHPHREGLKEALERLERQVEGAAL